MKYWLFDGSDASGPYDAEELKRLPGFTSESLICPDGAESADQWKPAQYYLIRPPTAKPPEPTPRPSGMGRIAAAQLDEPLSTPAAPRATLVPRRRFSGQTLAAALAALFAVASGALWLRKPRPARSVTEAPAAPATAPASPAAPDVAQPQAAPAPIDPAAAKEAVDLAKGFPVRSASAKLPAAPEDVLSPNRWREPRTLGEALDMRGLQALAYAASQTVERQGHSLAAGRAELRASPARWRAFADRFLAQNVSVDWSAEPIVGSRWRVAARARYKRGAAEDELPYEADVLKRTLKPLGVDAWFALDPRACAKWGGAHVRLGAPVDDDAAASAAPEYSISLPRGKRGPKAPAAKPATAGNSSPDAGEDGSPPLAARKAAEKPRGDDEAAAKQDEARLEKALIGEDKPAGNASPNAGGHGSPPLAEPSPRPAAPRHETKPATEAEEDKTDKDHKNAMDMSVDELQKYLKRDGDAPR
jgi:hypothetical protein